MPTHDIIDNRKEKLVDHINRILSSTESARFAVGYFFLSGLESIAQRLAGVKELRLLIGNTTNRETLEQLAEGYRRLELVAEAAEAEAYRKRTETKRIARRHTRRQDVHAQGPVRFLRSHLSRTRNRQGFPAIVPFQCRRHREGTIAGNPWRFRVRDKWLRKKRTGPCAWTSWRRVCRLAMRFVSVRLRYASASAASATSSSRR